MKIFFTLLLPAFFSANAFSQRQNVKTEILTDKETVATFSDAVKNDLELVYPISRVYKFADKSGQYYTVLSGNGDADGDHRGTAIRAVTAKYENGKFINIWEVNGFIDQKKQEQSIWIFTKYTEIKDFDNDELADAIIVYGTAGQHGNDDGKIEFVIYYKGKKISLVHQNGPLDIDRRLQIDKAFYSLPEKLQRSIKDKMEGLEKSKQAIFPVGWRDAMGNQKTTI